MDLTQFLLQQAQALQKQLHNLLEKADQTPPQQNRDFEVTTQLSLMDSLGDFLPTDLNLRVPMIFSRLSPFFEAGVLFQSKDKSWCPQAAFQRGFFFNLSSFESQYEFLFPAMNFSEVKRAQSTEVIRDLGLEESLINDKVTALVFRPHPDYLFLLLSELGEPWLKLQIDKAQTKALVLLSDYL